MKYKYWFAHLPISDREKRKLLDYYGNEETAYKRRKAGERAHNLSITGKAMESMSLHIKKWSVEKEYESFQGTDMHIITWEDKVYPQKLKDIVDPPYALFYRGALPKPDQKAVAVVGARGCSEYGRSVAEEIGRVLSAAGIQIISGMAVGIDSAAHFGAIRGGHSTYAVLGCGADICYPKSSMRLYEKMAESGGILSENPPGTAPLAYLFPRRNRIISALSDVVIVVEAREKSGSLITADLALDQGKDVYSVPGRVKDTLCQGTNRLISQGADIFLSIEDFMRDMGINGEDLPNIKKSLTLPLEKNEMMVYSVLDLTPRNLELLMEQTNLNLRDLTKALLRLQKSGYIKEIYKNYYIKV